MKYTEQDLLDPVKRKEIIAGFDSAENNRRKRVAFKGYECLKDKTINYTAELLLSQFDVDTFYEMQYALTNVSILRKVIDKLARVYSNGVKRSMGADDRAGTEAVEDAAKYFRMTERMKKTNRFLRTFKNTLVFAKPVASSDEPGKFDLAVEVLPPFLYDVVPDSNDATRMLAVVTSDYSPSRRSLYSITDAAYAMRGSKGNVRVVGDKGETLVQSFSGTGIVRGATATADKREFIWWTKNYHFTTDASGNKIDTGTGENPIKELPFVNFAGDQDGEFYAQGGEDLIDAGVSVNVQLTNIKHVGVQQGYGQLYMTGKDLPKSIKVGPTQCIQIEVTDKDDPAPQIGFLNASPQLDSLKSVTEMEVALMLSTNNLSTSGFSTSLQGSKDFSSGIAMMIDKSESTDDIGEQALTFVDREPKVWGKLQRWADAYGSAGILTEAASLVVIPPDVEDELMLAFPSPRPLVSESEQLDALAKRRELRLSTEVEILMRDDPSLSEEKAREKLLELQAEDAARMSAQPVAVATGVVDPGADAGGANPADTGGDTNAPAQKKPGSGTESPAPNR